MENVCVFLDPGHGGRSPFTGAYTTSPAKQYQHSGTGEDFHCDGWFYEGVSNRDICFRIEKKLAALGIPTMVVAHTYEDTPLRTRVDRANRLAEAYDRTAYVSIHSNASPSHRARGYEIYTGRGQTDADALAEEIYVCTVLEFGAEIKYRTDQLGDHDHDKEKDYYVLRNTTMPAVLVEYLFFDNLADAKLLANPVVQDRFANATAAGIVRFLSEKNL